jgi:hypothetical protein
MLKKVVQTYGFFFGEFLPLCGEKNSNVIHT